MIGEYDAVPEVVRVDGWYVYSTGTDIPFELEMWEFLSGPLSFPQ
jgi:hypothetical protein